MKSIKRTAFIVSDRTAVTAEALGHSLLSQFPNVRFTTDVFPFVDTREKADKMVGLIH